MTTDLMTLACDLTDPRPARRLKAAGPLVVFGLITMLVPCARATDFSQQALEKADAFLRTEDRGKEVLSYIHFGADYHGHRYLKTLDVNDGRGSFALVYRFWWEKDGITDAAFLCDSRGYVYKVQIMSTNGVLNPPFLWANASIAVLGHSLIEMNKEKLSDEDRRQLHELVNKADAKALLEWSLRFEQAFQ